MNHSGDHPIVEGTQTSLSTKSPSLDWMDTKPVSSSQCTVGILWALVFLPPQTIPVVIGDQISGFLLSPFSYPRTESCLSGQMIGEPPGSPMRVNATTPRSDERS